VWHEIDDRRAPVRVVGSRDDPSGLVEEDVVEWLLFDALPVDFDDVVLIDDRVELARLTVHLNPPFTNQLVRVPSGRDSRAREKGIQSHLTIVVGLDE
jgi:hypothetical protein